MTRRRKSPKTRNRERSAAGAPRTPAARCACSLAAFSLAAFSLAALSLVVFTLGALVPGQSRAQSDASSDPARPGILSGLRDALLPDSPEQAFRAARRLADADEALARMRELSENRSDPDVQARACLWLGQYYYGLEAYRDAASAFEAALPLAARPETRAEVRFWAIQCRNLLEQEPIELAEIEAPAHVYDVLALLADGDASLRRGDPAAALRRYLTAEGGAERMRCLSPLYYRVALVLSDPAAPIGGLGLEPRTLERWEPAVRTSAERALVAGWSALPPPAVPASAGPDSASVAASDTVPADSAAAGAVETFERTKVTDPGAASAPRRRSEAESPASSPPPVYVIQLGAYRDLERARNAMEPLVQRGLSVRLESGAGEDGATVHRIRLGQEASRAAAVELAERLCRGLEYEIVATHRPGR